VNIGLFPATVSPVATAEFLRALGEAADAGGFHSLWVPEHVLLFDEYGSPYPYAPDGKIPVGGENGMLEPFAALSFLAAVTSRVRLGTGICLVPQRNPVYTAKSVADVDWLSGGRVDFGVGVGWLAEEFQAVGVPWEKRGERCREYLEVMRRLWEDDVSEHKGEVYELPASRQYPKPVQKPHPPIHFGGESDAALRRVADVGQGWYGFSLEPEAVPERLAFLTRLLEERGRRREDVLVSICPYLLGADAAKVERYREAGVDQVILPAFAFDVDGIRSLLDSFAETIVEPAAAL
jgi:probable F420-dependent oxidoreductase